MKKLWLALVIVAVLCLGCWAGAEESCTHETGVWKAIGDNKYHGVDCLYCGKFLYYQEHFEDCRAPGKCWGCGEQNVQLSYLNHITSVWKNLGDTHQEQCEYCGIALGEKAAHYSYCDRPSYCNRCQTDNVPVSADRMYHCDSEWIDLGDGTHQKRCTGCGVVYETESHLAYCSKPGTCYRCGIVNLPEDEVAHTDGRFIDLGREHQFVCDDCGYKGEADSHVVGCKDPTHCVDCWLEIEEGNYSVNHSTETVDLGEMCGWRCVDCGEDILKFAMHTLSCGSSTKTCLMCQADLSKFSPKKYHLSHANAKYTSVSDTHHKVDCKECGVVATTEHWKWCDGNDVCPDCQSKGVTFKIKHYSWCGCDEKEAKVPGDADGNSSVTLADVRAILAGNVSSEANADVTGDGKVDQQDVLRIMQYISGWDVTLQ